MSASARAVSRLCVVFAVIALQALLADAQTGGFPRPAVSAEELVGRLEVAHPEDLGKDPDGRVISVLLRQGWASDQHLALVSSVGSIQSIALEPTFRVRPSRVGIAALSRLTNLSSLNLACSGYLPEDVFRTACSLKQLQRLSLVAAYPPVAEYNCITNLTNLTQLRITHCTNFADAQVTLLTNLVKLRILELAADGISDQGTNVLSSMAKLTNVIFKPLRH